MRRFLGRAIPFLVLATIAACIGFGRYHVSSLALGQQAATQYTCTALLDGGSTNVVCGSFSANYSPLTVTCQVGVLAGDHSSAGATVNLLGTGNGANYATIADAGLSVIIVANGDAGAVNTSAGLVVSPYDPWQGYQIMLSGVAVDGGTSSTGYANCQASIINVQTLH